MDSKELLKMAVQAADGRRAEDITALKVDAITPMADYFVIIEAAHENGVDIKSVEGKQEAQWVLIDLGDVVVHVFREETRHYYNLEKLWSDAPLVDLGEWVKE